MPLIRDESSFIFMKKINQKIKVDGLSWIIMNKTNVRIRVDGII